MPSTKELKQRIKGIKSTGKITRAMEMISAVKMRKAVANVVAIRPYAQASLNVLERVSRAMRLSDHLLFQSRPVKKVLFVVVTSNRGLCGSFNANVIRQVKVELEKFGAQKTKIEAVDFVSIGKKGDQLLRRFDGTIKASFLDALTSTRSESVRPIARLVREEYESGRYDKVMIVYTDYVSPMVQKTNVRRLLPLSQGALQDEIEEMSGIDGVVGADLVSAQSKNALVRDKNISAQYQIEPTPEMVLETLIPRLIEMQMYHALLESNASQEAARMMAMRNATDAAKDMVADFTLSYNQLRQAKVTQEIAELSAGMAAVSG